MNHSHRIIVGTVIGLVFVMSSMMNALAGDKITVGAIDAWLTIPPDSDRPPVVLLIAGSGPTDHDGNSPQIKPATLKKLSQQLVARGIATLRYDKRGAGIWKPEFGKPEDFRFEHFVDDAVALVRYLQGSGTFSGVSIAGHSEGGLITILAAQRTRLDGVVLLTTTSRRQGDLLKEQLVKQLPAGAASEIAGIIDAIMAGQILDPPPVIPGLNLSPAMQPALASAFVENPLPPLRLLTLPVLSIGGGRDLQVERLDFDSIAAALPAAKTLWLPNMNHLLVDVSDNADNMKSYNEPDRELNSAMVDAIAGFVMSNAIAR